MKCIFDCIQNGKIVCAVRPVILIVCAKTYDLFCCCPLQASTIRAKMSGISIWCICSLLFVCNTSLSFWQSIIDARRCNAIASAPLIISLLSPALNGNFSNMIWTAIDMVALLQLSRMSSTAFKVCWKWSSGVYLCVSVDTIACTFYKQTRKMVFRMDFFFVFCIVAVVVVCVCLFVGICQVMPSTGFFPNGNGGHWYAIENARSDTLRKILCMRK